MVTSEDRLKDKIRRIIVSKLRSCFRHYRMPMDWRVLQQSVNGYFNPLRREYNFSDAVLEMEASGGLVIVTIQTGKRYIFSSEDFESIPNEERRGLLDGLDAANLAKKNKNKNTWRDEPYLRPRIVVPFDDSDNPLKKYAKSQKL